VSKVIVILDGQYGSCGKGAYAQWLARHRPPGAVVRNGGPNAGHSVRLPSGDSIALRHVPAAVASYAPREAAPLLLLPGAALVNPHVLREEIDTIKTKISPGALANFYIDEQATVITEDHEQAEQEAGMREKIGSTREGVGAAQADKVMRRASLAGKALPPDLMQYVVGTDTMRAMIDNAIEEQRDIHLEMTQGVGLGLHYGHYPKATSRDITPGQAMSDAYLSPSDRRLVVETHMLARTYPIRVAGNSGPFGGDEIDWEQLYQRTGGYVQVEKTTVTKLPRRVAEWSHEEALRSAMLVRPTAGVLMFADYLDPRWGRVWESQVAHPADRREAVPWLQNEVDAAWERGVFDVYRRPFQQVGADIHAVSVGFGGIFLTPASPAHHSHR